MSTQEKTSLIGAYKGHAGDWLYDGFTAEQWRVHAEEMADQERPDRLIDAAFTIAENLDHLDRVA